LLPTQNDVASATAGSPLRLPTFLVSLLTSQGDRIADMACDAIGIYLTLLRHAATRTTVVSPAVDVGFEAVSFLVGALTSIAPEVLSVAGVA